MPSSTEFDVESVKLEGSNLIEASAGTGKTYSIGILVLRLLLEKKITVNEILMVTFTKAAVAVLEERIRSFIRMAYRASMDEEIGDKTIEKIIRNFPNKEKAKKILKDSVLFLDETSVLTIHGFCQKTLSEFAFETNQLFRLETLENIHAVVEDEINRFWRKYITSVARFPLSVLLNDGVSRKNLSKIIAEHLNGKKYHAYTNGVDYRLTAAKLNDIEVLANKTQEAIDAANDELHQYIADRADHLKKISAQNKSARTYTLPLIDTPELFVKYIAKNDSGYIKTLYSDVQQKINERDLAVQQHQQKFNQISEAVICAAIQESMAGISAYKQHNSLIAFDDMIVKVFEAFYSPQGNQLSKELQKKYKAVFIDEFQDTDKLQYDIFRKAFGNAETIVFYIGDPKQSIYAWRKADIFTYFRAYDDVDNLYEMNKNYRSSEPIIKAMNDFFVPEDNFDTFYFKDKTPSINYIKVHAPTDIDKGAFLKNGQPDIPITITMLPNKDSIREAVVSQVTVLLFDPTLTIKGEKIKPSDIGILVRSNREASEIKKMLTSIGIPAVTIGEEKIFQSEEAPFMVYLLEAIHDSSRKNINKALLSSFTCFDNRDILQLNDETVLDLFKHYRTVWDQQGVYAALMTFVADFKVQQILLQQHTENGERIITNLYHLIELAHKQQTTKKLSAIELISWLRRSAEGMETEGDEYQQRIENDDDAVKLVTVHSSKGLEYKIVLAPFLDLMNTSGETFLSFRDPVSNDYISVENNRMDQAQIDAFEEQQEQENRRIIYVAVTRAIYKCYLFKNTSTKRYDYSRSSLAVFLNSIIDHPSDFIEIKDEPCNYPAGFKPNSHNAWTPLQSISPVHFTLLQENWKKLSFSKLAVKPDYSSKNIRPKLQQDYDEFVFKQLTKGDKTGNLLHTIFEKIHFSESSGWSDVVDSCITKFAPAQRALYSKFIPLMLEEILHTTINATDGTTFKMADVTYGKRIHEFEFDFPVGSFDTVELSECSEKNTMISVKDLGKAEGIMNGKIDLFFEHNGRYYILDWKSNFLGDALTDYSAEKLIEAMNENNYHLQYLIYTVAIRKYLQTKLSEFNYQKDFGGVIYLFLRGVRKNSESGIYFNKPSEDLIDKISNLIKYAAAV